MSALTSCVEGIATVAFANALGIRGVGTWVTAFGHACLVGTCLALGVGSFSLNYFFNQFRFNCSYLSFYILPSYDLAARKLPTGNSLKSLEFVGFLRIICRQ